MSKYDGRKASSNGYLEELRMDALIQRLGRIKISDSLYELTDEVVPYEMVGEKHDLYTILHSNKVNHSNVISKRLLPDKFFINTTTKNLLILEIKFQETAGSVDEKLQTSDFKRRQYQKLFVDYKVDFRFVLNDWFTQLEYTDVLDYINELEGSSYIISPQSVSDLMGLGEEVNVIHEEFDIYDEWVV